MATGVIAGLLLVWGAAPSGAAEPVRSEAASRCFAMIGLFDRIVQSRFDHRILGIEVWELAEARRLRERAEVDCARGSYWFGTRAIEDALSVIGVVPPTAFEEEAD